MARSRSCQATRSTFTRRRAGRRRRASAPDRRRVERFVSRAARASPLAHSLSPSPPWLHSLAVSEVRRESGPGRCSQRVSLASARSLSRLGFLSCRAVQLPHLGSGLALSPFVLEQVGLGSGSSCTARAPSSTLLPSRPSQTEPPRPLVHEPSPSCFDRPLPARTCSLSELRRRPGGEFARSGCVTLARGPPRRTGSCASSQSCSSWTRRALAGPLESCPRDWCPLGDMLGRLAAQ